MSVHPSTNVFYTFQLQLGIGRRRKCLVVNNRSWYQYITCRGGDVDRRTEHRETTRHSLDYPLEAKTSFASPPPPSTVWRSHFLDKTAHNVLPNRHETNRLRCSTSCVIHAETGEGRHRDGDVLHTKESWKEWAEMARYGQDGFQNRSLGWRAWPKLSRCYVYWVLKIQNDTSQPVSGISFRLSATVTKLATNALMRASFPTDFGYLPGELRWGKCGELVASLQRCNGLIT